MPAPIAITPGEPAGIGPEIVVRLLADQPDAPVVVVANRELMQRTSRKLGSNLRFVEEGDRTAPGEIACLDVALPAEVRPGELNHLNSPYVVEALDRATDGCLDGTYSALVTGPVHKHIINAAGIDFTGHTERLAERTGADQVVMLLAVGALRVALATTHLALREVPDAITREGLAATLRILLDELRLRFGVERPRVAVCGLNPHAGEGGRLGREEIDVITPVCSRFRVDGWDIDGPLPADTVFLPQLADGYDAILAMYHDQGLPVLKRAGFGDAVNVTLGLPIIRTSVDHGTALDLAGRGEADWGSLKAAYEMALDMVVARTADDPAP
ncbi:MAG: 4-hydroxythreonine-4-phosphate dehydrogenase PdxA [Xanthomonadales bacterium]|nr:4-hydroxythreonine-4-phosphate dehydrogenase PdxA [Xanthomonadales bacterium]